LKNLQTIFNCFFYKLGTFLISKKIANTENKEVWRDFKHSMAGKASYEDSDFVKFLEETRLNQIKSDQTTTTNKQMTLVQVKTALLVGYTKETGRIFVSDFPKVFQKNALKRVFPRNKHLVQEMRHWDQFCDYVGGGKNCWQKFTSEHFITYFNSLRETGGLEKSSIRNRYYELSRKYCCFAKRQLKTDFPEVQQYIQQKFTVCRSVKRDFPEGEQYIEQIKDLKPKNKAMLTTPKVPRKIMKKTE
jgi:hypothetical protein